MKVKHTEEFVLKFPPSVNHYWRNVNGRTLISRKGREYRKTAWLSVQVQRRNCKVMTGDVELDIFVCLPDRRRRDVDNLLKALLDGLEYAKVYENDSQIQALTIRKCPLSKAKKPGYVKVAVTEICEA